MRRLLISKYQNYYVPAKQPERGRAFDRYIATDPKKGVSNIEYIFRLAWAIHFKGGQKSSYNPGTASIRSTGNEASLNALNLLYYAALDPTIAQLLGLYYIDESINDAGNFVFKYTVVCVYPDKKEYEGCLFPVFPSVKANLPLLDPPLTLRQLVPCKWEFDNIIDNPKLLCRVGLKWETPVNEQYVFDGDMEKYKNRFISPVVYEMVRNSQQWPDVKKNILDVEIRTGADGKFREREDDFNYTDNKIRFETKLEYQLKGIDLFGQQSKAIEQGVLLQNNLPPAVPVNLLLTPQSSTSNPKDPPEPEHAILEFDYGPYQYLQSPDTTKFAVYYKKGPLQENKEVQYTIDSGSTVNLEDESKKYEIQFVENIHPAGNILTNPITFPYHRIRFIKDGNGNNLPAAERRILLIHSFNSTHKLFAMGEELLATPLQGKAILERDNTIPLNNASFYGWQKVNTNTDRPIIQPFPFTLSGVSNFHSQPTENSRMFTAVCKKAIVFTEPEDRSALSSTSKDWLILFINRPLHETGIFTGGKLKIDSSQYDIAFQGAGKKAGNDMEAILNDPDLDADEKQNYRNSHAQIWLGMDNTTLDPARFTNNNIFLIPPSYTPGNNTIGQTDELNPIQGLLQFKLQRSTTFNSNLYDKGDLLFSAEIKVERTESIDADTESRLIMPKTIRLTAKLASDIYSYNGFYYVLARLNRPVASINNGPSVFFSRYIGGLAFDVSKVLEDNPIPAEEAKQSLFFAIAALKSDSTSTQKISALSQPVQYTQIRNTKPLPPDQPFPCGSNKDSSEPGYVSLPDAKGMSYFKLCWGYNGTGYRFEVARASVQTILTEHHKLWRAGLVTPPAETIASPHPPAIEEIRFSGFQIIKGGIVEATMRNATTIDETYLNGRIYYSEVNYFQVIKIVSAAQKLWLKPSRPESVFSTNPAYKLEAVPDYNRVINDDQIIKSMGDTCPNAFGIVTGTPVRTKEFNDFLPGKGTGKYFYKVRGVDAAENFSEWSSASVGIYQLDTAPPNMPLEFSVEIAGRIARLSWKKENISPSVGQFEIFKLEQLPGQNFNFDNIVPWKSIVKSQLTYKKITMSQGYIAIPGLIKVSIPNGLSSLQERIDNILSQMNIAVQRFNSDSNLFNRKMHDILYEKTNKDKFIRITGIKIKYESIAMGVEQSIPEGQPLRLIIHEAIFDYDDRWWSYDDNELIAGRQYYYSIRETKSVRNFNIKSKNTVAYTVTVRNN